MQDAKLGQGGLSLERGSRKMVRLVRSLAAATVVAALVAPVAQGSQPVRDSYVVVLHEGADARAVAAEHRRQLGVHARFVYRHAINGYAAQLSPERAAAVRADRRVASLSPVYPLDPTQGAPAGKTTRGQVKPTNIDRIEADLSSARSGDGVGALAGPAVAVMDGGVDPNNPDLNVRGGINCSPDAPTTGSWADENGHGTHVAGTIAAKDDGAGVVGVAPGVPVYSVRVVKSGSSANTTAHVLCGVDWINGTGVELGIRVVNASLGYTPQFGWSGTDTPDCGMDSAGNVVDALHLAICNTTRLGVSFVAAMGNSTLDFRGTAPAAFDEVLSVSATADFDGRTGAAAKPTCSRTSGADDAVATFSNFTTIGSITPDADWAHSIAAPGVCVTSSAIGGGTAVKSGTSMASPAVAGTIALCIATGRCAALTPAERISKLRADAFARKSAVPAYGYKGEPTQPNADGSASDPAGTRYYGPLVYAGGY
jgi:subtilisin family serine protease